MVIIRENEKGKETIKIPTMDLLVIVFVVEFCKTIIEVIKIFIT